MAFVETPRERTQRLGRCTGPHDGAPAPGQVGLDYKAACCTCGKRVAITVRGRFTHHKGQSSKISGPLKSRPLGRATSGARRPEGQRKSAKIGALVTHMTAAEKTTALLVLAEALQAATLVGDPAPQVARLGDWMRAPLRVGDLAVETSTGHRGPDPSRVGVVLRISRHQSAYERVTEILVLDPPCGKTRCQNQKCIHRRRWSNATFVRVPATAAQLAEALGRKTLGAEPGVGRDSLIAALADAGIKVEARSSIV